jgi:adenylate cyclase
MPLKLNLFDQGVLLDVLTLDQPIEIGRREKTDPVDKTPTATTNAQGVKRWVIADLDVRALPRKVCLFEPVDGDRVRITNIHSTNRELYLTNGTQVLPGSSAEVALPAKVTLPREYSIEIASEGVDSTKVPSSAGSKNPFDSNTRPFEQVYNSILLGPATPYTPGGVEGSPLGTLTELSSAVRSATDQVSAATVLGWIEQAIIALQCPVNSPKYFLGIAQALARIIDMDRAEIILWNQGEWEYSENRSYVRGADIDYVPPVSKALLQKVLETKQVAIHPDPKQAAKAITESQASLHTAIASPILDILVGEVVDSQVMGVLYADRRHNFASNRPATVLDAEQKLVAILSTAVASSIARMKREQLVTKYQQFFSPKVTEAISKNPLLLEGEAAEVSVLFCDIRGFSKATETIGPEKAMFWVSETLSELSSIVLDMDGVLVDYIGDEMFAMWGAPEKTDDHAFRAAMAAKRIMDIRSKLDERFASILPRKFDVGIGICTGSVRVGNTGSKQKFKYGPMGKTVNMGSRLQGLTGQWGVTTVIDQATASCLPQDLIRRRLSKATVIGMEGAIDLYELMSTDGPEQTELVQKYESALALYENQNFREAVRAFGELIQQFPSDGPSMLMLVRSVNEVVSPSPNFTPVWTAKSKS